MGNFLDFKNIFLDFSVNDRTKLRFFCIFQKFFEKKMTFFKFFLTIFFFFFLISSFWGSSTLFAQFKIVIPKTRIALNEPFNINVEGAKIDIDKIGNFPNIQNFYKVSDTYRGDMLVNGVVSEILTQAYHPTKTGNFIIPAFKIKVDGQDISQESITIYVGEKDKNRPDLEKIQKDSFIENPFLEFKEDAFLGVSTSVSQVKVGEAVHLSIALYVATANEAYMKFVDLDKQVTEIAKKLKPNYAWEENFNIGEISKNPPIIRNNNKDYKEYKFFEAVYFPMQAQNIVFPKINLKVNVLNKIETDKKDKIDPDNPEIAKYYIPKTFESNPIEIQVLELPPHPLRDKTPVGTFYLQEVYPNKILKTGENFKYYFQIIGEGNISALPKPTQKNITQVDIFAPQIQQIITRGGKKITGNTTFEYTIFPKDAGEIQLKNYFEWIYFNTQTQKYDTLRPQATLKIEGESVRNQEISTNTTNIYNKISKSTSKIIGSAPRANIIFFSKIIFAILIIWVVIMIFWRRKK